MRYYSRLTVGLSLCLMLAVACGDDEATDGTGGTAGTGGAGGEGGTGGTAGTGGAGGEGGTGGTAGTGGAGGEGGTGGMAGAGGAGGEGGTGGMAGAGGEGGTGGMAGSFDFPPVQQAIDMCCNNNALPQQSIIPITLSVDPGPAVPGGAFTAALTGLLVFPESFLDVAQTVVVGGVQQADLIAAQATVQTQGGATGGNVTIPAILPPGTCLIDSSSCTLDSQCVPTGSFNPCQNLVTVPTTTNLATCQSLDPPGCTPGTDCVKSDTHALNGFCVTGPLPIPLSNAVGNYTAGPSGDTMLFGWAETGVPGGSIVGGVVTIGAPVFTNPVGPNGVKVNASGLSVAIECIQGIETGDELTDPVTCGVTPDNLLVGSGVAGTDAYLIP